MDPYTLHVTDAMVNLTCGLAVAIVWFQRPSELCFGYWSAALAVFGTALSLEGSVGLHPGLGAAYYGGLAAGILLMFAGFRSFDGGAVRLGRLGALALVPAAAFLATGAALPATPWAELVGFLLCCALSIKTIAYVATSRGDRSVYRRLAAVTMAAQLALTLGIVLLLEALLDAGGQAIAVPLADQVCTIVIVICLLAMSVERSQRRMEEMAYRDVLTGALNRAGFLRRMADEPGPAGLLLMDLDHFKGVNDRYGHLGGDAVLREFARRAAACLPPGALFARMGGEEFVLLVPGATHAEATAAAQAVRLATRRDPVSFDGRAIAVTVSIGLAMRREAEPLEEAMRRADAALYRAKLDGRDRIAA